MKQKGLKKVVASTMSLALVIGAGASVSAATDVSLKKLSKLTTVYRGVASDATLKFPAGQSLGDNAYTRMLKKDFNILVRNSWTSADYSAKVNSSIFSGDLPTYLQNLTYTQYKAAYKAGLLADISGAWNKYASAKTKGVYNSNKALFDSLVKVNGKMYAIPSSQPEGDFLSVMWIRKDWLDKAGLAAPKTLAEVEKVAAAFKSKGYAKVGIVGPGKGDALYNTMFKSNQNRHFDQIFASYGSFPGIWVKGSNGKAVYGSITSETKSALSKLRSMYSKGLFDKALFTNESGKTIANNDGGIFFGTWWYPFVDIGASHTNDPTANWQPYVLNNSKGKYMAKGGNAAQTFTVVSKDATAAQKEAVVKMLNIFKDGLSKHVSSADQNTMGDGVYPMYQTFSKSNALGEGISYAKQVWAGKTTQAKALAALAQSEPYSRDAFNIFMKAVGGDKNINKLSNWDFAKYPQDYGFGWSFGVGLQPYISGKFTWVKSLSFDRTNTMDKKWANLETLEYTTFTKIITGKEPLSSFDTFVKKWKNQGGSTITTEIQKAID